MTAKLVTINFVMKNLVAFSHALADATRWRIIQLVMDEALCVCELADILRMPQSSVSSHVQVIRKAGLLESEKRGKWIYCRVGAEHRALLTPLARFFSASPGTDAVLTKDAANAVRRLAERDEDCCPPPKKLARRRA